MSLRDRLLVWYIRLAECAARSLAAALPRRVAFHAAIRLVTEANAGSSASIDALARWHTYRPR
jgi:hypothetical protein